MNRGRGTAPSAGGPGLVDFRKDIDGLAQLSKAAWGEAPFRGRAFAFRNGRATAVKVLAYDGQGFWLFQKRLSESKFRWWPSGSHGSARMLAAHKLQVLLSAGDPNAATCSKFQLDGWLGLSLRGGPSDSGIASLCPGHSIGWYWSEVTLSLH